MSSSASPIIDFYPIDFRLDVNGAAYAWMGVNLLPFIDQERLFKAMKEADKDQNNLTPEERNRNKRIGDVYVYFRKTETPSLKCLSLNDGENYEACFSASDRVAGLATGRKDTIELGQKILSTDRGEEIVQVKSNKVVQFAFIH